MTKEQQRGDDRGATSAAVQEKDKSDKAAKHAKATDAAEAVSPVVLVKQLDAEPNSAAAISVLSRLNPSAWIGPVQSTWAELVRKATAKNVRVDVISRADDVLIRAEVPGIAKDRLDLAVAAGKLTIRGQASSVESGDYYQRELPAGEFARHIALPADVQVDKATATVRQGLLEIVLPKAAKQSSQKIAIQ